MFFYFKILNRNRVNIYSYEISNLIKVVSREILILTLSDLIFYYIIEII